MKTIEKLNKSVDPNKANKFFIVIGLYLFIMVVILNFQFISLHKIHQNVITSLSDNMFTLNNNFNNMDSKIAKLENGIGIDKQNIQQRANIAVIKL